MNDLVQKRDILDQVRRAWILSTKLFDFHCSAKLLCLIQLILENRNTKLSHYENIADQKFCHSILEFTVGTDLEGLEKIYQR